MRKTAVFLLLMGAAMMAPNRPAAAEDDADVMKTLEAVAVIEHVGAGQ